jgi:hypothetical protein
MTIAFTGLLTAVVAERVSAAAARLLFAPLLVAGAGSLVYWYVIQRAGQGDLRAYALVQFGSLAIVLLVLVMYRSKDRASMWMWMGLALYGLAKVFEISDAPIYHTLRVVSGHTLKHVTAAAAVGCVAAMLRLRVQSLGEQVSPEVEQLQDVETMRRLIGIGV